MMYDPLPVSRICRYCGQLKFYPDLVKHKGRNDGVESACRECVKQRRWQENKLHPNPPEQELLPGFRNCRHCHKVTPISDLAVDRSTKSGVRNTCKACANERKRDPEYEKAYNKAYHIKNRERLNEQDKEYKAAHPEVGRQARERYRLRNKKKMSRNEIMRHQRYPEKYNASMHNYRARKNSADGFHTGDDIIRQHERQNGLCYWCSQPLGEYHADHYIPLSRGGTDWPENIVITCPSCNLSKNNRLPFNEWTPPNPLYADPKPRTVRICRFYTDQEAEGR